MEKNNHVNTLTIRNDWTREEIASLFGRPILELLFQAATVHRANHDPQEIQVCTLLSVKTGGCPEDCAYCPQAARFQTAVVPEKLMPVEDVLEKARMAKREGSTRFCMGAAWREVRNNRDFDAVLEMVKGVSAMGMEVCCTLGMLTDEQAVKLKEAGLYAYNHNLDTSKEFYDEIITTRKYEDRIQTLTRLRRARISVCSGGIIGMGETVSDRVDMLWVLSNLPEHPESVPVNALVPVAGTPLENQPLVSTWDMVRMIAVTRIVMPRTMVRLSAGRVRLSMEAQALCFMAGANSIFAGDKLLTTPNPAWASDAELFRTLALRPREAYKAGKRGEF